MIESGLITHLLNTEAVTEIVDDRIHTNVRPQNGLLPAIVLHRVSGPREYCLRGPVCLAHPRVQIDCLAYSASAAKQLADLVRLSNGGGSATLQAFYGKMGIYVVQFAKLEDDRDDYIEDEASGERGIHVVSMDFIVWFREASI